MNFRVPELMNPLLERSNDPSPSEPSGPPVRDPDSVPVVSELMLLPDGRILAHHLTPELASFLRTVLDSEDSTPDPEPTSP
jgi:hypothetical protein